MTTASVNFQCESFRVISVAKRNMQHTSNFTSIERSIVCTNVNPKMELKEKSYCHCFFHFLEEIWQWRIQTLSVWGGAPGFLSLALPAFLPSMILFSMDIKWNGRLFFDLIKHSVNGAAWPCVQTGSYYSYWTLKGGLLNSQNGNVVIHLERILFTEAWDVWEYSAPPPPTMCFNRLTPKSDMLLISPYNITPESNIRVRRTKEMINS